ncbi:helix-turn-helix domain-containing protein [Streptococcus gordonii]|uniref:helix-turn-helix domain-containing protein n=1 Tax=Streptococcus gordonii TaxID=1302 RepID=UPI0010DCEA56|nr:helix-turn-helix transcriptional regulator [Streptococcus gordonii]VTS13309.1 putative phage-associated protein [Streptococcus gordonii]VTS25153.1 putative phage-associated protein [Streptococcus gordonii]
MRINTSRVEMVLMNRAISAYRLAKEIGIQESSISLLRNGKKEFDKLSLEVAMRVQSWIDSGNYAFSYDYSELIEDLEEDIEEGLTDEYIYVVRGPYNEILEKCPIIDYYYTAEEIEEGDLAEKALTASVLAEMKSDNEIF